MGWACNTYWVEDGGFVFLVDESEGKITLQRGRTLLSCVLNKLGCFAQTGLICFKKRTCKEQGLAYKALNIRVPQK
jgi:hypothetical protein